MACALVQSRLHNVLAAGSYDFIFCSFPVPGTHGGHKAASLLALRTVRDMKGGRKLIVLGGGIGRKTDIAFTHFSKLKEYTGTKTITDIPSFFFDKTVKFGFKSSLDYRIVVNWKLQSIRARARCSSR